MNAVVKIVEAVPRLAEFRFENPELLILDEPLHGLDISNKKKVTAIIEEL